MRLLESKTYKHDLQKVVENANINLLEGKTFFITGGTGLICSAIVDILLAYGKTRKIYVGSRNIEQLKARFGDYKNIVYVKYDTAKGINLSEIPDYIIAGAGLASPELYTLKPVETMLSNIDGIHHLLDFAKQNRIKRLLYISSSEVYGIKKTKKPFKENNYGKIDIGNIRSSYAISKRASEMLCRAYYTEYDVDTIIVRPGHIYGPSAKKEDRRVSSEFAFKAAEGINLTLKSSGAQKRSYCYSLDCAIQILTVLQKGNCGQAYNIGNDAVLTISEMAKIIADAGNVKLEMESPTKIEEKTFNAMHNSSVDNSKIKELNYKDTFTVKEGLEHTVKILKEIKSIN